MPENKPKSAPPFSLRLSPEERKALEVQAGGMALGAYIRARLFGENGNAEGLRRGSPPVPHDRKSIAQALALLGRSELGRSLQQIAAAARGGALHLTPEGEATLRAACEAVLDMKKALMAALGIKER
jgi:hypothetical protein